MARSLIRFSTLVEELNACVHGFDGASVFDADECSKDNPLECRIHGVHALAKSDEKSPFSHDGERIISRMLPQGMKKECGIWIDSLKDPIGSLARKSVIGIEIDEGVDVAKFKYGKIRLPRRILDSCWESQALTIAHEVGHGILAHAFDAMDDEEKDSTASSLLAVCKEEANGIIDKCFDESTKPFLQNKKENMEFAYIATHELCKAVGNIEFDEAEIADSVISTIEDMMCAATGGKMFCGHSKSYYRRRMAQLHEFYANMISLKAMYPQTMERIFPNASNHIEVVLRKVADGARK